tara:strand:- start:1173 stop:1568 length:396 start_codon:yes stop_codon:yes gene_type:complete
LALTDVDIGPDGNMYFCVGGRGGQSSLYRVSYKGSASTELSNLDTTSEHAKARKIRHMLEDFHGHCPPPHLQTRGGDGYQENQRERCRFFLRIAFGLRNIPSSEYAGNPNFKACFLSRQAGRLPSAGKPKE